MRRVWSPPRKNLYLYKKDNDLRVCTWNIRTLNGDGASAQLADALIKCRADITAIQEMRWIGQGCKRQAHCDIYYSCHAERREFGCGFVVSKRLRHLVSAFTPVDERLATIRIKAKFYNISLICAHAPTEEKDDAVKDAFYAKLEDLYDKCPAHDVKMVLGDFNAKVRQEGIFGPTVGQFSLHTTTSPNGLRLIDFAAARNMVVCSTRFQHLDIHKATWLSPDRSIRNQIDHVVIDGRHASNVLDVRTFRGPNMDSDHYLVAAKVRLRISASRIARSSAQRKLDVKKLRSQRTVESFSAQLSDKLRQSPSSHDDIGGQWANISHSLRATAETVLGFERPPKRNQWYDEECRAATAAKNAAYKRTLQSAATRAIVEDYRERRKDERRLFRRKKREQERREREEIEKQELCSKIL